jgi:exopolysaccharide biosynthesis polyprenyl glycosylphosphotransferase
MRDMARDLVSTELRATARIGRTGTLEYLPRAALLLDGVAMVIVALTAGALRTWFGWFADPLNVHDTFWTAGPLMLVGWIAVIGALGGYRERLFGSGVDEYKIVLNASLLTAGLVGVACYITSFHLSRSFFVVVFTLGSVVLVAQRFLLRRALHRARRAGRLGCDVVIAGSPSHVDEVAQVLGRESWLGYHVLGALVPEGHESEETASGVPILGTTDHTLEVIELVHADVIFVAGGALAGAGQMRELVWELERSNVQVVVAPHVTDVSRERIRVRPAGGLPLVHIDPPRHHRATRRAKRLFDVALTSLLLFGVAPVFVFIALGIKLHDGGPVFFRQTRTGRDGIEFPCLKFRTMVVDAELRLTLLHEQHGYDGLGLFKIKDDPRITGLGRWLRRYSLDELPQLLNVLRGDMSLVGPRPPLPTEVATYDRFTRRRLHVRPGMTGLWQVSGRSDLSWSEAVRLDLYYVDNWSMLQDVGILVRTFGAVVRSRGAY